MFSVECHSLSLVTVAEDGGGKVGGSLLWIRTKLRAAFNKEWIFSYLDGGYAQGAGTTMYGGNTGAAG